MPQPIVEPAALSATNAPAMAAKEASTPSAVTRRPRRTRRRSSPAWLATASNLSDSTGRTQGIAFRISPPRRAMPMIEMSRAASPDGGPGSGVASSSAARAPSTKVKVSFLPASAASPASRIGTVRCAACPHRDSCTSGRPGDPLATPSTKRSGARNAASGLLSRTTRFGSWPSRTILAETSCNPAAASPRGTRARAAAIKGASGAAAAGPAGRMRSNFAE